MNEVLSPGRAARPVLRVPPAVLAAVPHLAGFLPGHSLVGTPGARWPRLSEGLLAAPRFGRAWAPVALRLPAEWGSPLLSPAEVTTVAAALRAARVGGTPGLPDPAPKGLGLPAGVAVLVLDPCDRRRAAEAGALLARAVAGAAGRPVLLARDPAAPAGARPVLDGAGATVVAGRLAPWTLIDLAAEIHALDPLLPALAGGEGLAGLLAGTACADPFHGRPWGMAEAIAQLADWRIAEAERRSIVACTGIEWFKLGAIRDSLASAAGPPLIRMTGGGAIRAARRAGGAAAVWASVMPPDLPDRAAAAGVPLLRLEDGFVRSSGLGVLLAPAASWVADGLGIHYDPAAPSGLETILATAEFGAAELVRAAALRTRLIRHGITKYNLEGPPPAIAAPPGARVLLVVGQVGDDAAMRLGGSAIRTNLDLLRAVRRAAPGAHILFKPHPDVAAGMRRGGIPAAALRGVADQVVPEAPIAALYPLVDEVHTIGSLAGFEALLRGVRVVCWGRPFYAGWGLTEDRDPPPRRGRLLTLDMLVAGALLRYPRYRDPATGLPCPPELVLERLAAAGPAAAGRPPRTPAWLRAFIGRASRRSARWWAGW